MGTRGSGSGAEGPLLGAWVAIGLGAALENGRYSAGAVALVTAGALLLLFVVATRSVPAGQWSRVVTVGAGAALLLGFDDAAGVDGSGAALVASHALTGVATVVVAVWLILGLPWQQLVTYGAIAMMTAAGIAMVISSPKPGIDVWYMLQGAGNALSHGHDIYTIRWTTGISYEQSNGFAYLPGSAVLLWPFHVLFGDVRYGLLVAMVVTATLIARVRTGSPAVFLGAFVVLYPKAMFGLEQSWVDPLVLCALCVAAYAVVRGRHGWAVVAFAVALSCKQQAWLVLPLALFWKDFGWKRAALSAGAAGAVMVPWIAAAPSAFYRGVVTYNLDLPARLDSLSLFTTALRHGWSPGLGFVAVATLGAVALALWRLPRDTYGFLLGSAVVMAVFNLANKQSFFNEWGLAAGLALAALAFRSSSPVRRDESRSEPHLVLDRS